MGLSTNAPQLDKDASAAQRPLDTVGTPIAPAIVRGKVVETGLSEFGGRNGDLRFLAPDPHSLIDLLPLGNPGRLKDLYKISMDEIVNYLMDLGLALDLTTNVHMQRALELSYQTAPTTPPLIRASYENVGTMFRRSALEEVINSVGRECLEGWTEEEMSDGRTRHIRAIGARTVHVVAGNSPLVSTSTIVRNAITRGDAIIKAPSNDPFTAIAIARTMIDMAPDHPLTKHLSVAYWKGGDQEFEQKLYQPHIIEKIVAWGGFASVKHVTRYIQPGLELISLDPKRSISIVGEEAFASDAAMDEAAQRLATDIGALNQEACANARVVYAVTGTDEAGVAVLERFGRRVYEKMLALPERTSTPAKGGINRDLRAHLQAVRMSDDWFTVIGGSGGDGAMIVSKLSEPVDFAPELTNRVGNLVPVNSISEVMPRVDAYCQTVGVYPDRLALELRDEISLYGAQRIISLGYALSGSFSGPQDGIEPLRRMMKWILHEECDPNTVPPLWA